MQSGQPIIDDSMYREQPQISRADWNQMMQQQLPAPAPKQTDSIWPEKLSKPVLDEKPSRKKGKNRDDYSEEYTEGEENQAEGEDVTTTEAPKKVGG